MRRALIVSGGGSFGACGAGTLAALNNDYEIIAGISTGALMSPLVALNEWIKLKEAYTSVKNSDIFDTAWYKPKPFKNNGKLNNLAVLYALTIGNKTIATSNSLRRLIDKFLCQEYYDRIKSANKQIIVAAQNLNELPSRSHYFNIKDIGLEDFKDWLWCSANAPFFTSLIRKEWTDKETGLKYVGEWTDGGLSELIILQEEVFNGINELDIVIHRVRQTPTKQRGFIKDLVHNVERTVDAMRFDIEFENGNLLNNLQKIANEKNIKINLYWLPYQLSNNSLLFDKAKMLKWWDDGYSTAFDEKRISRIFPLE